MIPLERRQSERFDSIKPRPPWSGFIDRSVQAFTALQATPPYSPVTNPPSSQEDPPTNHTSSKDSAPSTPNGSELDSTTISQQTAATEVTQPPRSRASQV